MDKKVRIRALIRCAVLLSLLCASDTVRGQGNGDYDGDYYVDGDDFASWGACMTTPGAGNVPMWSPCGAFDFDTDLDVDLLDFGAFQAAFQKPAGGSCTSAPQGLKFWVGAAKSPIGSLGARATISKPVHPMKLCDELATTGRQASVVYVGVSQATPQKWIQTGYLRKRLGGWLNAGIFAESMAEFIIDPTIPMESFYNLCIQNPNPAKSWEVGGPPGFDMSIPTGDPKTYTCQKEGLISDEVWFHIDGQLFHSWENNRFFSFLPDRIELQGELFNKQDDLPGETDDPCVLSDFRYRPVSAASLFIRLNLADSDLHPLPTHPDIPDLQDQWDRQLVNPQQLKIWDKHLNP